MISFRQSTSALMIQPGEILHTSSYEEMKLTSAIISFAHCLFLQSFFLMTISYQTMWLMSYCAVPLMHWEIKHSDGKKILFPFS